MLLQTRPGICGAKISLLLSTFRFDPKTPGLSCRGHVGVGKLNSDVERLL